MKLVMTANIPQTFIDAILLTPEGMKTAEEITERMSMLRKSPLASWGKTNEAYKKNHPVGVLVLSSRTLNRLKKANIQTIGELIEYGTMDLDNIRGLGRNGMLEVTTALRFLGLELRKDRGSATSEHIAPVTLFTIE